MYATIRPHIIPLAESIHINSLSQLSAIGNEYGDIYEMQLELAKNSRLNGEAGKRIRGAMM